MRLARPGEHALGVRGGNENTDAEGLARNDDSGAWAAARGHGTIGSDKRILEFPCKGIASKAGFVGSHSMVIQLAYANSACLQIPVRLAGELDWQLRSHGSPLSQIVTYLICLAQRMGGHLALTHFALAALAFPSLADVCRMVAEPGGPDGVSQ